MQASETGDSMLAEEHVRALSQLAERVRPALAIEGCNGTCIDFLTLIRFSRPTPMQAGILRPSVCFALQGQKRIVLGDKTSDYGVGEYLITVLDMPMNGQVVAASPQQPYIGLTLRFEPEEILTMLDRVPDAGAADDDGVIAQLGQCTAELSAVLERLVSLMERGGDAFLAHLLRQELLYLLLQSAGGAVLSRSVVRGREQGMLRAVDWIRQHFAQPMKVEQLARQVDMSASHFHRRFKAMMTMGPLQYQKQLRLAEARRLLLTTQVDVATAAYRVGYESPSHFSREYRRQFGAPPAQDISQLLAGSHLAPVHDLAG